MLTDICIDLCINVCAGIHIEMCKLHIEMCTEICIDTCINGSTGMCKAMCIGVCAYSQHSEAAVVIV